jgi:P-type Ca2+ transporter type 2C
MCSHVLLPLRGNQATGGIRWQKKHEATRGQGQSPHSSVRPRANQRTRHTRCGGSKTVITALHTAVKGRARYKVTGLYGSVPLKHLLETRLVEHVEIHEVSASTLTGNVLVHFHPDTGPAAVASLLADVVTDHADTVRRRDGAQGVRGATDTVDPRPQHSTADTPAASRRAVRRAITQGEEQARASWHLLEAEAVIAALETSQTTGLSSTAAHDRLQRYGPNLSPESVPRSSLSMLLEQFTSLPVALLGVAAGISLLTGGVADALVIAGVVAMNATIGYVTESQSEQTIHALKSLVHPAAFTLRDGQVQVARAEEIVPGDVLVLRPGSYVVADARLLEGQSLSVDESALTGESLPVTKNTAALTEADVPLADRRNMLYAGTMVTGGQGLAAVVATGQHTEMGQIQALVDMAASPETPLQQQLNQMGRQLVLLSGAVCSLVFGVGLSRGYGLLEMLKTSISLAVAAVPEGLPTIATTVLALGIRNMRRHHVLIRRLEAVETLGCMQVICLDKTGTLTLNKMTVVSLHVGGRYIRVSDGTFVAAGEDIVPLAHAELERLMHVSVLCSETEIVPHQNGEYALRGSPTENALLDMAITAGVNVVELREHYPLLHMQSRAENRNFMSTLHTNQQGQFLAVKGSPNEVLALCSWHLQQGQLEPLTEADRHAIGIENDRMAGEALRVLGAAYREREGTDEDTSRLEGLTWLGLIGMADPVRTGVQEVIGDLHQAGIATVMITGDQSATAYAIGKDLRLSRGEQLEILDSTHLNGVAPEVMAALASRVHVFARVSPSHKLQIVQALQRSGKVVAMTGDGINDGPALKVADIGIAMGNTGTDVAREVADVVLEDDHLETMVVAVNQGRTIYNNIRKSVHFLLATNLSEIMVMIGALSTGLGQPLNAMQLLWINLLSDVAPGLALAMEPPEPEVLQQPPRDPAEPIITSADFKRIGFESAVLSAGTLGAYGYGLLRYGMGAQANTLAFSSLTIGQLLHAFSCRSQTHSVVGTTSLSANPYLTLAVGGGLVLQLLTLIVPGLRGLLSLAPLTLLDGAVVGLSALLPLVVNEATKGRS